MAKLFELETHSDHRGNLTVIQNQLPFPIERIFYIYEVDDSVRGGHMHKTTRQALICIHGSCVVSNNDGQNKEDFILDKPYKCLILETHDWHTIHSFSNDSVLLVLTNTKFDPDDYIYEEYYD